MAKMQTLLLVLHLALTSTAASLIWRNCTEDLQAAIHIDCANISVPLDWSQQNGEKITIALNRRSCTDSNTCRTLLYNPGGPGASGLTSVANDNGYFSAELKSHFHIIGMDPRGVGRSAPVRCDPSIYNQRYSLWPQNETQYENIIKRNVDFANSCYALSGDIVKHVDSANVAKDMNEVRKALGEDKLNFFGISYGTLLATSYLEQFPEHVGLWLMDGILEHSAIGELALLVEETIAREIEFDRFAAWCNSSSTCVLQGKDVGRIFDILVDSAYQSPVPAPGCGSACKTNVTGDEILVNMNKYLHLSASWPDLAAAINNATAGNATSLSSPLALATNSTVWQGQPIACLDFQHSNRDVYDFLFQQRLTASIAPHTRGVTGMHQFQTYCDHWPFPVTNPMHDSHIKGNISLPPILMVNAVHDPQTSYVWAVNVRRQLPSALLLTREGDGHLSYGLHGEVTKLMDAYLINGTLPKQNTVVNS